MSTDIEDLERRVKSLEDAMSLIVKRLGVESDVQAAQQSGRESDELGDPANTAVDAAVGPEGFAGTA